MTKEQAQKYKSWVEVTGRHLRKWRYLNNEQRWFIFMNSIQKPAPRVSAAKKITETQVGMIWSRK